MGMGAHANHVSIGEQTTACLVPAAWRRRAAGACRQALTAAGAWTLDHSIGLGACVRSAVGLRAAGRCAGDASCVRSRGSSTREL